MKILFFCPSPRTADGGLIRVFDRVAKSLHSLDHTVHSVYRGGNLKKVKRNDNTSWDVPLANLQTRYKIPRVKSVLNIFRGVGRLHRLLSQVRPDIVNCHFASFHAIYFCLLKPVHGYKLVVTLHGSDVHEGENAVQQFALPWILRASDRVVTVSSALEKDALDIVGQELRSCTIHNGLDVEFWKREGKKRQVDSPSIPVVTHVGDLRHVKGQDVLLRAFKKLLSEGVTANLWLVGEGQKRGELETLTRSLGVENKVTFHGWCTKDEVRYLLWQSTVFAFPSREEGFGIALLEAMASGLPVVASRVGGIPEIINSPETGRLVQPNDVGQLASTLREVIRSDSLQATLGKKARRRAQDFKWDRAVREYDRLFRSLHKE